MKVPVPGLSGAEGKEKGKGVVVRQGLEEAQSETAGRRTGTGYEVWYIRDERARDREVLHPQRGVLYKSGVYARNVLGLTLGDLSACHVLPSLESDGMGWQKSAEAVRGEITARQRAELVSQI